MTRTWTQTHWIRTHNNLKLSNKCLFLHLLEKSLHILFVIGVLVSARVFFRDSDSDSNQEDITPYNLAFLEIMLIISNPLKLFLHAHADYGKSRYQRCYSFENTKRCGDAFKLRQNIRFKNLLKSYHVFTKSYAHRCHSFSDYLQRSCHFGDRKWHICEHIDTRGLITFSDRRRSISWRQSALCLLYTAIAIMSVRLLLLLLLLLLLWTKRLMWHLAQNRLQGHVT